jgi:GTPase SAR1 family protein
MSYFFRARANILGDIGAGKTALIRQLMADKTYADTSKNIEIREYNLETSQKSIKVELWDFKRDVINNETYRIFCASNCLYILVVNIRYQNEGLDNWLYLIKKYSRNPSVLIVRNITEVEHGNYEKRLFKSNQYNFILEVVSVNLHKKYDVDEFKRKFHEYVEQKTFPFSENEENIINHLKYFRTQKYIELNQFKRICNDNHINNEEEYRNLLTKLDSLGVCIHLSKSSSLNVRIQVRIGMREMEEDSIKA